MERAVSLDQLRSDNGSNSRISRRNFEMDGYSSSQLRRINSDEILSSYDFEGVINEIMNSMTTQGVVMGIDIKSSKNHNKIKKILNTLKEWIKSIAENVDKIETNFKDHSDDLTEYNEKAEERLSFFEQKFTNKLEMAQLSESFEEHKLGIGKTLSQIENIDKRLNSIIDDLSSLEINNKSLSKEIADKLTENESMIKSEIDSKYEDFQTKISILGMNLGRAVFSLQETNTNVNSLSLGIESLHNEMDQIRSNLERNEIQAVKNAQRTCEIEKNCKEYFKKFNILQNEFKNMRDKTVDFGECLESQKTRFNSVEQGLGKLSESCNHKSTEIQKQVNALDKSVSKIKEKVKGYDTKFGEMRNEMRDNKQETKRVENNLVQYQNQELKAKTTMESQNGSSGSGAMQAIGGLIGGAFGGPTGALVGSKLASVIP